MITEVGLASQTGGQRAEIRPTYSLRCTPQILGAVQRAQWHVEGSRHAAQTTRGTDNPLIFPDTGMADSWRKFLRAAGSLMVSDYMRMGLIEVALLAGSADRTVW